jgi:hypothetical protein
VLERQENKKNFDTNAERYSMFTPSEKKLVSTTYYGYDSVDGRGENVPRQERIAPIQPRDDHWDDGIWDN